MRGAAHSPRNFEPSRLSHPQLWHFIGIGSSRELSQQRLRVRQVGSVEALGEQAVDLGERFAAPRLAAPVCRERGQGSSSREARGTSRSDGGRFRWHGESRSRLRTNPRTRAAAPPSAGISPLPSDVRRSFPPPPGLRPRERGPLLFARPCHTPGQARQDSTAEPASSRGLVAHPGLRASPRCPRRSCPARRAHRRGTSRLDPRFGNAKRCELALALGAR